HVLSLPQTDSECRALINESRDASEWSRKDNSRPQPANTVAFRHLATSVLGAPSGSTNWRVFSVHDHRLYRSPSQVAVDILVIVKLLVTPRRRFTVPAVFCCCAPIFRSGHNVLRPYFRSVG